MREFKFRCWNKNLQIWINSFSITPRGEIYSYVQYEGNCYFKKDEIHLMQFTGLCDKYGKEIYEGDIVAIDAYDYFTGQDENEIYEVYWEQDTISWELGHKKSNESLNDFSKEYIEIIGNIYENHELVEKKS